MQLALPAAFVLLTVASCHPVPAIAPGLCRWTSVADAIAESNVIVLGRVVSLERLHRRAISADGHHLQLRRVRFAVEAILRDDGHLNAARQIEYYQYGISRDVLDNGSWDYTEPGRRYIVFLVHHGEFLRSTVDLYSSKIEVDSGVHQFVPTGEPCLGFVISRLLISPGDSVSVDEFVKGLPGATSTSISLIGYSETFNLLRPLLQSDNMSIRREACVVFMERLYGRVECLSGDRSSERARALVEHRAQLDANLRNAILNERLQSWAAASGCRDKEIDLLRLLAQVSDAGVRSVAQKRLEALNKPAGAGPCRCKVL